MKVHVCIDIPLWANLICHSQASSLICNSSLLMLGIDPFSRWNITARFTVWERRRPAHNRLCVEHPGTGGSAGKHKHLYPVIITSSLSATLLIMRATEFKNTCPSFKTDNDKMCSHYTLKPGPPATNVASIRNVKIEGCHMMEHNCSSIHEIHRKGAVGFCKVSRC